MSDYKSAESEYREAVTASVQKLRVISNPIRRVHYVDDALVMSEVGNTCVAIWRAEPNQFLFQRQVSVLCDIIDCHPEPIGFLCVVEAKTPAPSEEIRKASVEMLTSRKRHLACVAGVIADKGFTSAITRSVLAGMAFLLSRGDFRVKFTDTVEHAALWMANYVDLGTMTSYCSSVEVYRQVLANKSDAAIAIAGATR